MPRLFTALDIPFSIRQRLSFIRSPLSGAKWIEAEDMHITLRFAGDIDGRTADEFVSALASIRAKPFALSIAGLGSFGGREPKVLWAGVEVGAAESLDALVRANERAARAAGLEPEGRTFKAHVTLARMRGARQAAVARFLAENGTLRTEPFTVDRFVLLSARPGTGGPPYAVEAEFPFDGVEAGEPFAEPRPWG